MTSVVRNFSWLSKRQVAVIWTCALIYTAAVIKLVWTGEATEETVVAFGLAATVPPLLGWAAVVTLSWYRDRP